ncbi:MAG: hypothetical protein ACM35G_05930 [Planctomycetaceae bacterium]
MPWVGTSPSTPGCRADPRTRPAGSPIRGAGPRWAGPSDRWPKAAGEKVAAIVRAVGPSRPTAYAVVGRPLGPGTRRGTLGRRGRWPDQAAAVAAYYARQAGAVVLRADTEVEAGRRADRPEPARAPADEAYQVRRVLERAGT